MINFLKKITSNLDIIAAHIGLFILLITIPILLINRLHNIYLVTVAVGVVCIVAYLVVGKKLQLNDYYIKNWHVYFILGSICLIGLSQLWIVNLQFPNSLIGLDAWTHMRATTQELDIALDENLNAYGIGNLNLTTIGGYFSLMHLYLKSIMDITGLSYKWASLIFWGSLQTIGTIVFVYLNGKELINKSVGLLAAFLVSIASWVVYFGEWCIPNGIGATLSLIVSFLFIKAYKTKEYWLVWLSLIILPIAVFIHILVAVWVVGTIICMCLFPIILDCIEAFKSWKQRIKLYHVAIPIVSILLVACWYRFSTVTSVAYELSATMETIPSFGQSNQQFTDIAIKEENKPIVHDVLNNGNLNELVIDSLGMFLYIGIGTIGILMMLRFSDLDKSWAILCIGILVIGFIPNLFGITILKERWWYLSEVFMSIPLAVALIGVYNK